MRWIFSVVLIFLATMTLFRFILFWSYNPPGKAFTGSAFIMGLRFDLRWAAGIGLAMMILCTIPFINPFKNAAARRFWNFFLPLLFLVLLIFYGADYYHFDYLHQRLNATVLNYLQDAGISFNMMKESYPLFKISTALILFVLLAWILFRKLLFRFQHQTVISPKKNKLLFIIFFLLLVQCVIGKIIVMPGQFPLRWSDAYTLSDDFKANLALNPMQSFFSSLSFRKPGYNLNKVKAFYPMMAGRLGVRQPDSNHLNFERNISWPATASGKPNVVLVICESFSAYKSSMYGSPLNTTPYFAQLCNNGIFFDRCFTPAYGTARGVWATITGIPDVESPGTASRNLNAVNQHTIINDFQGYNHFYFLGGSATWANIRGLLTNNIGDLKLFEEQDFKAAHLDTWGISDKNLLLEANNRLKLQTNPFFAIIQTADNHRPYSIPGEDEHSFKLIHFSTDSLKRFGFDSNEEMNAFRYTDFCYQQFIEAAQKEKYFDNTIFIFVGDHGIRGNAGELFPRSWTEQGLTCEHVPLLFYAPKLIKPNRIHEICSQVDILPTVAALAKIPYTNTTFGRDLLDTASLISSFKSLPPAENLAFIFDEGLKTIGLVSDRYYFLKDLKSGKQQMVALTDNSPVPQNLQTENVKLNLSRLTDAFYETALYMLLNNKKR